MVIFSATISVALYSKLRTAKRDKFANIIEFLPISGCHGKPTQYTGQRSEA